LPSAYIAVVAAAAAVVVVVVVNLSHSRPEMVIRILGG
jgi:hypothetical protein